MLRAIVDPVRLAVLGASVGEPASIDRLAGDLDVPRRVIAEAVGSLRSDGLVDDEAKLVVGALRAVAESIPPGDSRGQPVEGPWTDEEATILGRFFDGGRLTSLPTQTSKRLLVLGKLAQEFEPGRRYTERDVNFKIQLIHSDCVSVRRYLVHRRCGTSVLYMGYARGARGRRRRATDLRLLGRHVSIPVHA